jgi:hypothetical protein
LEVRGGSYCCDLSEQHVAFSAFIQEKKREKQRNKDYFFTRTQHHLQKTISCLTNLTRNISNPLWKEERTRVPKSKRTLMRERYSPFVLIFFMEERKEGEGKPCVFAWRNWGWT